MDVRVPIKTRDKQFGLFSWTKDLDFDILTLFNRQEQIVFLVTGKERSKKVSYKYRRFTLGKKFFDKNPEAKFFLLTKKGSRIHLDII